MDFNFSAQDEAFREEFRSWLHANLPKAGKAQDAGDSMREETSEGSPDEWKRRVEWHKKMHAGGWVGISWPKEYGGRGATPTQQIIYNEELAKVDSPVLVNGLGIMLAGPTIIHWGSEEQKKRHVPKILSADELWCQGYSEPDAGSDVASLKTRAVEEGDYFIVNGQKVWTTIAHRSDFVQLFVRTDPDLPKHKGMSALLVDMKSPGVSVRPLKQITGDSEFNEIFFEDVRVPKENLLGPLNMGWQVLVATLMHERFGIGETLGGTEQLLHALVQIAKAVNINGRPAIEDNDIRQQIAQFAIETTAKKYNGLRSLSKRLKGQQPGPEASISKLLSTDLGQRMTKFITRLLGEYALLERHTPFAPEGDWMRRILGSEGITIAGGTSPVQKNMIGERILLLPKG